MTTEQESSRYPRRRAAVPSYSGQDDETREDEAEDQEVNPTSDDGGSEESDELGEDEEDFERLKSGRKRRGGSDEGVESRRSKRATKYSSSMAEPTMNEFVVYEESEPSPRKRRGGKKSRSTKETHERRKKRRGAEARDSLVNLTTDDEEKKPKKSKRRQSSKSSKVVEQHDSEWDEDEEDEPLKIQRILGSKSEQRKTWNAICAKKNTSEVEHGSMWYQKDTVDEQVFEERYFVKWNGLSYLHCSWETQGDLDSQVENARNYFSTYFRKSKDGFLYTPEERGDGEYFDPAFTQVDRILEVSLGKDHFEATVEEEEGFGSDSFGMVHEKADEGFEHGVGRQFLVKWGNSPYSEATYEYERDLLINDVEYKEQLKAYHKRNAKPNRNKQLKRLKAADAHGRQLYQKTFGENSNINEKEREELRAVYQKELRDTPFKNGGQLRDYQAEGVSWMIANYLNNRSCILADEMGLGKTLQTAATLNLISTTLKPGASFLIVAPLSTIPHWLREFQSWTDLNAIVYHGGAEDRCILKQYEFAFIRDRPTTDAIPGRNYLMRCKNRKGGKADNPWMVDVVIATPEMLVTDDAFDLSAVNWDVLVVDEAHRLKNHNSKLGLNLRDDRFKFNFKILCTGTPIQNDMKELWTLMYFIDDKSFGDMDEFLEKYGNMKSKEAVDDLHETLRPYILRRLKEDVEKSMPPKEETIIDVELTLSQKQYYRALYEKNVKFLNKNKTKALDGPSLNNLAMQLRKVCNSVCLLNGIEEELRKENVGVGEADFLVKGSGKLLLLDKLLPLLEKQGHRVLIFSQFKIMLDILEDYLADRKHSFSRIDGSITGLKRQIAIDRFQAQDESAPFIMMLSTRAGGVGINLTAADTVIIFDSDWNPQNDLQAMARVHRIGQKRAVKIYRLLSSKSYEMQMFNLSSMKMGLDQAVLKGFEGGPGDSMSKEQVEKLLRHGAYDIMNEEKEGSAEKSSNDFGNQTIDDILARRTRTVVHDANGGNAGGTFSKASFKVAKSPDKSGAATSQDVDVEDPQFWQKMLGSSYKEEEETALDPKQRRRNQTNYNEDAGFDKIISAAEAAEASDESYQSNDDDWDSDEDDLDSTNKSGKPRERAKWGGSKSGQWSLDQAGRVDSLLNSFGYGNMPWEKAHSLLQLQNVGEQELKRMSWSLILTVCLESCEYEAASLKRKAEKAAEKECEPNNSEMGGVLASGATPKGAVQTPSKSETFRKFLTANSSWVGRVISDAVEYAKAGTPRDPDVIAEEISPDLDAQNDDKLLREKFSKDVWPSLRVRGWNTKILDEGPLVGQSIFVYHDKTFASISETVQYAQTQHPELSKSFGDIVEHVERNMKRSESFRSHLREQHLAMTSENATFELVEEFLKVYAPLQLVVDRANEKKLPLSRKVLSSCPIMSKVFQLVKKADAKDPKSEAMERLSSMITIDKRKALPHPEWTFYQDAVLTCAVHRHGYIDNDKVYSGILADDKLKLAWGSPFLPLPERSAEQLCWDKHKWQELKVVAKRAGGLLANDTTIAKSDFFQQWLPEVFCLEKHELETVDSSPNNDSPPVTWTVNVEHLESKYERIFKNITFDLPSKKELVKRLKGILAATDQASPVPKPDEARLHNNTYNKATLDLKDPSNEILIQLIRGVLNLKKNVGIDVARSLLSKALDEAQKRAEEERKLCRAVELSGEKAMQMRQRATEVVKQLRLAHDSIKSQSRLFKNLLRVTIGDPVQAGAKPSEPLFPVEPQLPKKVKKESLSSDELATASDLTLESLGRQAVSTALKRSEKESNASSTKIPSLVQLTEVETLILTTACSYGIPVCNESMAASKFTWVDFGSELEEVASCKMDLAKRLVAEKGHEVGVEDTEILEKSNDTYNQAKEYAQEPDTLAKKTLMLVSKLLRKIGLISSGVNVDSGLGTKVLKWCSKQISGWAHSLNLIDSLNEPLALTAIDFLEDIPAQDRSGIGIVSCLDREECRKIFADIASLSRLRSFFGTDQDDELIRLLVEQSLAQARGNPDGVWEAVRPDCWKPMDDDSLLLKRLLRAGFGDLLDDTTPMASEDSDVGSMPFRKLPTSEYVLQKRVNVLVRHMHEISLMEENSAGRKTAAGRVGHKHALKENNQVPKESETSRKRRFV